MRFLFVLLAALFTCACGPVLDDGAGEAASLESAESALTKRSLRERRLARQIRLLEGVAIPVDRLASGGFVASEGDTGDTGGGDTGGGDTGGGDNPVDCEEESGWESTECSVAGETCICSGEVFCYQDGDHCVCELTIEDVDCGGGGDTGDTGIFQVGGAGF